MVQQPWLEPALTWGGGTQILTGVSLSVHGNHVSACECMGNTALCNSALNAHQPVRLGLSYVDGCRGAALLVMVDLQREGAEPWRGSAGVDAFRRSALPSLGTLQPFPDETWTTGACSSHGAHGGDCSS